MAGAGGARPRHGRPGLPRPDARGLISGDALWRNGFGILFAEVIGEGGGLEAARATLEALARLSVDWVIPGHGAPFVEVDEAFEAAFARLRYFEEDGARIARNAIRACVTFWLLERRRVALDDLPAHLASVPSTGRPTGASLASRRRPWPAGWRMNCCVPAGSDVRVVFLKSLKITFM
jgi:glyoxylase-like metal-dependent hydrolase (beta-lactamase superfamily II)